MRVGSAIIIVCLFLFVHASFAAADVEPDPFCQSPVVCPNENLEVDCQNNPNSCYTRVGNSMLPDSDGDGVPDCGNIVNPDNCLCTANGADDPDYQSDSDNDGIGDACDPTPFGGDDGGPSIDGEPIVCPISVPCVRENYDSQQAFEDACFVREGNSLLPDSDKDGHTDLKDNCVCTSNANQLDDDNDGIGNSCDTVTPPPTYDLDLTKTVSDRSIDSGDTVTYTITIDGPAENVVVRDRISAPSSVSFDIDNVRVTGSTRQTGYILGTGITLGTVSSSATITYDATFTSSRDAQVSNTASATANNNLAASDSTTVNIDVVEPIPEDLRITKTASTSSLSDDDIVTYTVRITGNADYAQITDTFSGRNTITGNSGAQLTAQSNNPAPTISGQGTITGTLANGYELRDFDGTATIRYRAQATAGSVSESLQNTAEVEYQRIRRTDSASVTIQSTPEPNSLSVVKSVDDSRVNNGEVVTYTVRITGKADFARITDTYTNNNVISGTSGARLTAQSSNPTPTISGDGTITGRLATGYIIRDFDGTATIRYRAQARSGSSTETLRNSVLVTYDDKRATDSVPVTIVASTPPPDDQLQITKTASPSTVNNNEFVTYTVKITGNTDFARLTDTFTGGTVIRGSDGARLIPQTSNPAPTVSGEGTVSGSLASGYTIRNFDGTATIQYTAQARSGQSTETLQNTARVSYDNKQASDSASVTIRAQTTPPTEDLQVSKSVSPGTAQNNEFVTYTVKITGNTEFARITDTFSRSGVISGATGARLISQQSQPTPTVDGQGTVSGSLQSGYTLRNFDGTATIRYTAQVVSGSATETLPNTVSVTYDNKQETDTARVRILAKSTPPPTDDLEVSKTVSPSDAADGEQVTYTIRIQGESDEFVVQDSFSAGQVLRGDDGARIQANYDSVNTNVIGQGTISGTLRNNFEVRNFDGTAVISYTATATSGSSRERLTNTVDVIEENQEVSDSAAVIVAAKSTPPPPGNPDWRIVKGVSDRFPEHNDLVSYSVAVTNIGDDVGTVTVTDSIADDSGLIQGSLGGEVRYAGQESVSARRDGRFIQVQSSGSLASQQGVTLIDVQPRTTATISYQARIQSDDLGFNVRSIAENTASASSSSDTVALTLIGAQGPVTPTSRAQLTQIPNQVLTCGQAFPIIDLDDYVIGDSQYRLSVSGNRNLQVSLDQSSNELTVVDPVQDGRLNERLTITLTRSDGSTDRQTLTYSVLENFRQTPILTGIPNQIIDDDDEFDSFRLRDYVQVSDEENLEFYAVGSELLSVTIGDDSTVNIDFEEDVFENLDLAQLSEAITFGVVGCSQAEDTATFTAVNDDLDDYDDYPYNPTPGQQTCAVSIDRILYDDTDCDGVIDLDDNCPLTRNPSQSDANNDGVGDACDVMITCNVRERNLGGGRAAEVEIVVQNNLDTNLGPSRATADIPGLATSRGFTLPSIPAGSSEIAVVRPRIPACAQEGGYRVICGVRGASFSTQEQSSIRLGPSQFCQAPGEGGSEADVYEIQDVIAGNDYGNVFPITVRNNEATQKSYILRAEGLAPWGDYVFESGNVLVIPPGGEERSNLRVFAPQGLSTGQYPFRVEITSEEDSSDVLLVANVIEPSTVAGYPRGPIISSTALTLVIIAVLIIGLGLLLGLHKKK